MFENRRIDRVSALIQKELSTVIHRSLKDPRVKFCSITQVDVSLDLKYADVKVSVIGDKQQKQGAMAGLKSAAGYLRREVGGRIDLRYVPELRFKLDQSIDHLMNLDGLLKQVRAEEEKLGISSECGDEIS
ncbi:MAG: 30S ribosome-binding factor RbfA [Candidatus Poribacteria bacterium]|nr:30S ribosome-binding factor RbfA [Candidatus Poribacteria bacterium]